MTKKQSQKGEKKEEDVFITMIRFVNKKEAIFTTLF